jgi:hypothetical protein
MKSSGGILINVNSHRRRHANLPILLITGLAAASLATLPCPSVSLCASTFINSTVNGNAFTIAQDDDAGDENEVPSDQVEKYVAVYKAMHENRSLTVEQAAAKQGMSLQQFRQLEDQMQRDDAALQHARDELQAAAVHASPNPSAEPSHTHQAR